MHQNDTQARLRTEESGERMATTKPKQKRNSKKSAPQRSQSALLVIDDKHNVYLETKGGENPIYSMPERLSWSGVIRSDSVSYQYKKVDNTEIRVFDEKGVTPLLRMSWDNRDGSGYSYLIDGRELAFGPEGIGMAQSACACVRLITRDQTCKVFEISKEALDEEVVVLAIACWGHFHCV